MDFPSANQRVIEEALNPRVADLLKPDAESIFYDTTSLHCEADDEQKPYSNTRDKLPTFISASTTN